MKRGLKLEQIKPFNVILWDINSDHPGPYDIMPHLFYVYKGLKPAKRPKDFESIKTWIKKESFYHWWSRCEYEIIVSEWPNKNREAKIDVNYQVMMNIDNITKHFIENIL